MKVNQIKEVILMMIKGIMMMMTPTKDLATVVTIITKEK